MINMTFGFNKKTKILAIFRHCVSVLSISPGCVAGAVLQTALFVESKKKVMGRLFFTVYK